MAGTDLAAQKPGTPPLPPPPFFTRTPAAPEAKAGRWAMGAGPQPQRKFLLGGAFNPRSLRTLLWTDLVLVKKLGAAELEGACALHLPCARPSSCRFHSGEAQRKRKSCGVNPDIGNRSLRWSPWTARGGSEHKPPCLKCHSPVSPTPDLALVFHSTWHNNRRHQHYFVCLS